MAKAEKLKKPVRTVVDIRRDQRSLQLREDVMPEPDSTTIASVVPCHAGEHGAFNGGVTVAPRGIQVR